MTEPRKLIDAQAFQSEGYLQEVNRRFLHPLGLALQVVRHDDGTVDYAGVWDSRDDLEGIVFADDGTDDALLLHAEHMDALLDIRAEHRRTELGYVIQPVEGARNLDDDRLLADVLRRLLQDPARHESQDPYLELPEPGVPHLFIEGGLRLHDEEAEAVLRARTPA